MTSQDTAPTTEQFVAEISSQIRAGQHERAKDLAQAALGLGRVHPLFLNLRAYWLQDRKRPREALADLEHAAELAPGDLPIREALGLAYTGFDRWADAIAQFEIAVQRYPNYYPCWFNLASARECLGDLLGAKRDFERSAELAPGQAQPLAALASLAVRRADWAEARRLAEAALAADPKQHLALVALANTAIQTGDHANAETLISVALAGALPRVNRAMMLALKGDLRHAERRYDEAFAAYGEANALRRELYAGKYAEPGRETAATFTELLIETVSAAPKEQWRVAGRPAPSEGPRTASHVFLMGFARSGTTLLENVLAANPAVATVEEKELLADAVQEYLSTDTGLAKLAMAEEAQLAPLRESYWRQARQYCAELDGKVFVDKRPLGASRLPLIAKLFPTAKILFALRDPRDVILSCFRRQFVLSMPMYQLLDLRTAARYYDLTMQLAMLCKDKFDQPWHFTRHEAMVSDFDGELKRVCDFIGLAWNEGMRDFVQPERSISSVSSTQILRGLNSEGVGVWQHYRSHLAPVFPVLKPWIESFGYKKA